VERFRTTDGRTLAYSPVGAGPPLVCHPGGPGFSARYFGDLGGLDRQRTLVLLDPRGTGGSDPPPDRRAYATDDYARDVEELRTHLALDRIDLLGHSHGGVVAQAYAIAYPNRVGALVLASTAARFGPEQLAAMEAGMESRAAEPWYDDARAALEAEQAGEFSTPEELTELVLREFPFYFARYGDDERAWIDGLRDEVLDVDALRLFNEEIFTTFDFRPELRRIAARTLVIAGSEDFITGPVCADELATGIASAELVVLPDCGHVVFVEARTAFCEAVLRFLG
jgi:pimeloyl-ACP methyl ester carboxylesterase